jgi:hypothetical protein
VRLYNNLKRSEEKLTGLFIGGDGSGSGVRSCASMAATGQTMMPRHHHPSLARPRDGNCDGGGRGGARRRLVCKLININRKKTINAFIILIFIHLQCWCSRHCWWRFVHQWGGAGRRGRRLNSAPFKTKIIKQFNPFGGKLAILFRSSLVIYPLAKTASPMYIAVTVGGVKLHQFFIVHAPPFLVCPSSPRELDMIENLDPLGVLISLQPQPIALFLGLRPVNDFEIASVACN